MSRLAIYVLKGVPQAALLAAAFLTLSLLFPPFVWLSSATVALVTLRKGWQHSISVLGLATLAATFFCYFALDNWRVALALEGMFWLPVIAMALALRATVKLNTGLIVAAASGVFALTLMFIVQDDPAAMWLSVLREVMQPDVWAAQLRISPEEYDAFLVELSLLMPGSTVACLVFSAVVSLLLARHWQAKVFNPGGFQEEYHQLRMGQKASIVGLLVLVLALLFPTSYIVGLLSIAMVIFLFQGLAVVHGLVKLKSLGVGWLSGMYVLCAILPHTLMVLGGIGVADTWIDLRKRAHTAPSGK